MRPSCKCVFLFSFVVASRVARSPQLDRRQLVAVSDNIAQLTRVTTVWVRLFVVSCRCFDLLQQLYRNAFTEIPAGVLVMTQLTNLNVSRHPPIRSLLTR